jgi:hypothetical protein
VCFSAFILGGAFFFYFYSVETAHALSPPQVCASHMYSGDSACAVCTEFFFVFRQPMRSLYGFFLFLDSACAVCTDFFLFLFQSFQFSIKKSASTVKVKTDFNHLNQNFLFFNLCNCLTQYVLQDSSVFEVLNFNGIV